MPRLLSILKDRNCKAQINERSLKEYFSLYRFGIFHRPYGKKSRS